jgi:hypothetical protein
MACCGRYSTQCWRPGAVLFEEQQPARIRKRNRVGPYRESEGAIVPFEDTGQQNPVRGKGPCFVHATEERRIGGLPWR